MAKQIANICAPRPQHVANRNPHKHSKTTAAIFNRALESPTDFQADFDVLSNADLNQMVEITTSSYMVCVRVCMCLH